MFVEIDDVFVRKDLYEGKYKPDLKKLAEFHSILGDNCVIASELQQLKEYVQRFGSNVNQKIEL